MATQEYAPLTDEERQSEAKTPEGQVLLVVKEVKQRKRGFAACVFIGVLLILLLALFVPRKPGLRFRELGVTGDVVTFYPDLKFESRAPVATHWNDLVLKLEWFTTTGSVQLATFHMSSTFKTPAFGSKHVFPGVQTYDAQYFQLDDFRDDCLAGIVRIRYKGHIKTGSYKFPVRTPWVYITCYLLEEVANAAEDANATIFV